mgnify:CR=1 FL=1
MKTGRTRGALPIGQEHFRALKMKTGAGSTAAPWKARPVPDMDV